MKDNIRKYSLYDEDICHIFDIMRSIINNDEEKFTEITRRPADELRQIRSVLDRYKYSIYINITNIKEIVEVVSMSENGMCLDVPFLTDKGLRSDAVLMVDVNIKTNPHEIMYKGVAV